MHVAALVGQIWDNRACSPYGLGIGARAGVAWSTPVYLGGAFVYHLGSETSGAGGANRERAALTGVEAGYEFAWEPVVLRPYAGIGTAVFWRKTEVVDGSYESTERAVYTAPGVVAIWQFGETLEVGVDARFVYVPPRVERDRSVGRAGFGGFAHVGARL